MYGNCGQIEDLKSLYENMAHPNIFTFNIVLKAYTRNGMLDFARETFKKMPIHDVVSWSTMIGGLSQWGHYQEALDLFCQMQFGSVKPDNITYVCVLNACSNLLLVEKGIEIHASIVSERFESDVVIGTALINMYGKCRRLLHAVNVFNHMPNHDIICWNAMMTAFSHNNEGQSTLCFSRRMMNEGILPSNVSFLSVLDACADLCLAKEGQRIHVIINNYGFWQDLTLGNALLNMYGKCGIPSLAWLVFERMSLRDVISWNSMIASLAQNGKNNEALHVYHSMQISGIRPNDVTFVSILNACASLEALEEGQIIHTTIVIDNGSNDDNVDIALVNMYGKCRCLCNAKRVFSGMISQNVVAWNVMIASLVLNNQGEDALESFDAMLSKGLCPDNITYASAIDACICVNDLLSGQNIHAIIAHLGIQDDSFIQTSLISMYGKGGDLCKAKNALIDFPSQSLASMNAYLSVMKENGHEMEALNFFHSMLAKGIRPDNISFVHVFDLCAALAVFDDGEKIHNIAIDLKCEQDLIMNTALINMYGKCGSMLYARRVFERIQQSDAVLCNAMISVYAQGGHILGCLCILLQMVNKGIKLNQVTFISMLMGCSHAGEVELGRHLFVSMNIEHGMKYLEDHYVCMIDILGRAGILDEAEQLITSMYMDASAQLWLTLLAACQIHNDMERAWLLLRACCDLKNAAFYVLMSNLSVRGTHNQGYASFLA
ncbi:hypothetical protein KP509_10G030000 [Ceratopteris richardii]|nr:hypothetical protein KP509_10G030000 [Ceratopteris richardii]